MAVTDAPTVYIDGAALASSWSVTARIALGGLAITWGRRTHLERAVPAQLKLEVLDTDGHLASSSHLTGKRVMVVRGDGIIIYRGRVDDYTFDHVHIIDPSNTFGIRRRVWRITISSACKLAELAGLIPAGTGNEPIAAQTLGPNYWEVNTPAGRMADVRASIAPVLGDLEWYDPYPMGERGPLARWRGVGDGITALEHIEGLYNAHPLAHANYQPHEDRVAIARPATTAGIRLYFDGTIRSAVMNGHVIPARTVAVPNGYEASTGVDQAVDVVLVNTPRPLDGTLSVQTTDVVIEHPTARYNPAASGRREYRVTNDTYYSAWSEPETVLSFEWPFLLDTVTDEFGSPRDGGRTHEGIDFAGGAAVRGAEIHSIGAGTVVVSEYGSGWGNYVIVDHGNAPDGRNLKSLYAHMPDPGLEVGSTVSMGDMVGRIGNTGNSFGDHLHMETWIDGRAVNPRDFMAEFGVATPTTPVPVDEGAWAVPLARDTAAMLDQLNGKVNLPTVRLDWRHFTYPDGIAELFIDTFDKPVPLYFPGSVFAVVLDAASQHQIIGGTLVYFKGWTLDATLAPALGTKPGVSIDGLCASDVPTIADFDPDLTIADLGNVTQGVPA
ncbi:MAG: Membrane protein related to metalloendopeptidase [Mycobacterium sp.]|nr:Membrane protein related to metalloendopeptidase [Mycobacterium sp.]